MSIIAIQFKASHGSEILILDKTILYDRWQLISTNYFLYGFNKFSKFANEFFEKEIVCNTRDIIPNN